VCRFEADNYQLLINIYLSTFSGKKTYIYLPDKCREDRSIGELIPAFANLKPALAAVRNNTAINRMRSNVLKDIYARSVDYYCRSWWPDLPRFRLIDQSTEYCVQARGYVGMILSRSGLCWVTVVSARTGRLILEDVQTLLEESTARACML
jgi:hypothetical protein